MAIFAINNVGATGVIKDRAPHELPPTAWSSADNIRFTDGIAEKANGYTNAFPPLDIAPYALLSVQPGVTYNWLVMGLDKVYVYDGATYVNITRQTAGVDVDYNTNLSYPWTGCVIGNVPVINNGVDTPQMWLPTNTLTKLTELSNWPANTLCRVMRAYKQYLVGLHISKSSVEYPTTLKWSHPADPNTVPSSWDETDPTKDAGEYTFSDTGDWLVDCLPLRDSNIVYKENSVWAMQFIGGVDIFRFSKLFGNFGALSRNCAVEFVAGQHLVLSRGDVMVHDGQSARSILTARYRNWLNSNINQDSITKSFVVALKAKEEVWICFPTGSSTFPDRAIVWNWIGDTLSEVYLPETAHIAEGIIDTLDTSDQLWDNDTETWDSDISSWNQRLYGLSSPGLLAASPDTLQLRKLDATTAYSGVPFTATLEKTGIGIPLKQGQPPDFTSYKFLQNVWPRIEGTLGGVVHVQVGTQDKINGAVTWQDAKDYTIGTTEKLDFFVSGRLLALRVSSDSSISWKLHGYEVDVALGGNF